MNRLVIVGNGFDLSHGMKTGYQDFMLHLLVENIKKCRQQEITSHSLFKVVKDDKTYGLETEEMAEIEIEKCSSVQELLNSKFIGHKISHDGTPRTGKKGLYNLQIESRLLQRLLEKVLLTNWVDVETEFYLLLEDIILNYGSAKLAQINLVNQSMNDLTTELENYLVSQDQSFNFQAFYRVNNIPVRATRFFIGEPTYKGEARRTVILDYNYTSTISEYLSLPGFDDVQHLKIHGSCNGENIIFGFGAVEDERYLKLKESNIDEFFEHLKRQNYPLYSEHSLLVSFIEDGPFEVCILGHSCGASDATTLHQIFNAPNLVGVDIAHIGKKDYKSKVVNISRHLDSEEKSLPLLRLFDSKYEIPQAAKKTSDPI